MSEAKSFPTREDIACAISPDAFRAGDVGGVRESERQRALRTADRVTALFPYDLTDSDNADRHVPGKFRCPKCDYTLLQSAISAVDGGIVDRDQPGERCPNDGAPLHRVSWREQAEGMKVAWLAAEEELSALKQPASDVTIGDFVATYSEHAEGVLMDHDTAHSLANKFKEMRDHLPLLLDIDHARYAVMKAIDGITIGKKTDDKLIVANLAKEGIYLARLPS